MTDSNSVVSTLSHGLGRTRKAVTWIYCSAILFPLVFAMFASVFLTMRNRANADGSLITGIFNAFYLILMALLASVPRSILPALLIWMLIAWFRPALDANKIARYAGLGVLLAAALLIHSRVYERPFDFLWLTIAFLAVVMPRLALPSLRNGLKEG